MTTYVKKNLGSMMLLTQKARQLSLWSSSGNSASWPVGRSGWVARLTLNGENRGIYMRSSIFWLVEHEDDINLLPIIWLAPTWKTLVMTRCISKMLWCLFAVSYWRSGNGYLMLHEANVYSLLQSNTVAVLNPYVVFQAFAKAHFFQYHRKWQWVTEVKSINSLYLIVL